MSVQAQIAAYIAGQPEPKRGDMRELDRVISRLIPDCRMWFLDGKNSDGQTVSNPNIGYGSYTIRYADGKIREFYQIGLSANTTGVSIYIMGLKDRKYLSTTFGARIGKASVSGYCVKFRKLEDIDIGTLESMIQYGIEVTREDQESP